MVKYRKKCEMCGKDFNGQEDRQKFCSVKCASRSRKKEDVVYCNQCSKEFLITPARKFDGEGRFCTTVCKKMFYRFRDNDTSENFRQKSFWTKQVRPRVVLRDNYSCQSCGIKSPLGRRLHVHHILPRWLGGTNELSNLITLCISCHALAEEKQLRDYTGDSTMTRHKRRNQIKV